MNKLRVGVLMGGKNIEREVSFNSGRTACDHLDTTRYDIIPIFETSAGNLYMLPWHFLHRGKISDFITRLPAEATRISWDDLRNRIDFCFIAVHGRYAEDGTLQGLLEVLGIAYLGAKVLGSALGMDKAMQRNVLKQHGIALPKGFVVAAHEVFNGEHNLCYPCIVKPAHEGSSLGIALAESDAQLLLAIERAATCNPTRRQAVLIEEQVQGMEFTCIMLQEGDTGKWWSLPITEIITEEGSSFYDYEQKYMPGRATQITPARLSEQAAQKVVAICIRVSNALGFETLSRIDGFVTPGGDVIIIDPNSLSGMGPASFVFHQAAEANLNHTQFIDYVITSSLKQNNVPVLQDEKLIGESVVNKLRVAVLLGGEGHEKEISLESGRNVVYKLSPHKYEVLPLFVDDNMQLYKMNLRLLMQNSTSEIATQLDADARVQWSELTDLCDFVFIALHGGKGENGSVQGTLEMLGLPYNGSGVLASGLCMNKYEANKFLAGEGFVVPKALLVNKDKPYEIILPYPLIVKPHDDGCSTFVSKVTTKDELEAALATLWKSEKTIALVEECIEGVELTVGVTGNEKPQALPPSQPAVSAGILSIEEKFLPGAGENITPANLPQEVLDLVMRTMEKVYVSLGLRGYARIDCFYIPETNEVIVLEINTLPGLTPATCLFAQAAEIGMRPMEFIDQLVQLGLQAHAQPDHPAAEEKQKQIPA